MTIRLREYWTYQGEEDRENPFRKLRFKETPTEATPSFSNAWVQSKILKPNVLDGINAEAQIIAYALIETGCRPSEIVILLPENICLDAEVPHIRIRPTAKREFKSMASARDIPLVGVSLEAMKRAPNGFPHYRDKGNSLSAALLKPSIHVASCQRKNTRFIVRSLSIKSSFFILPFV